MMNAMEKMLSEIGYEVRSCDEKTFQPMLELVTKDYRFYKVPHELVVEENLPIPTWEDLEPYKLNDYGFDYSAFDDYREALLMRNVLAIFEDEKIEWRQVSRSDVTKSRSFYTGEELRKSLRSMPEHVVVGIGTVRIVNAFDPDLGLSQCGVVMRFNLTNKE